MGARSLVKVREEAPAQPSQVLSIGRIAAENPLLRDGTGVERERARDRDRDVRRARVGEDIPEVAEQVRRVHRMAYHAVGAAQLEAAVRSHEAEAPPEEDGGHRRRQRADHLDRPAEPGERPRRNSSGRKVPTMPSTQSTGRSEVSALGRRTTNRTTRMVSWTTIARRTASATSTSPRAREACAATNRA